MATLKQLMTLMSRAGIDNETRRDIVFRFTNGRTQSTRQLTQRELDFLVSRFQDDFTTPEVEMEMRRKRSVVLTLATRTGIKHPENWHRFNNWMLKNSVLKKRLMDYDYYELDVLMRQFRALEANYKASAEKPGTKAWYAVNGLEKPGFN